MKPENTVAVHTVVALCATGAEKFVSNELKKMGLSVSDSGYGRVRFRSDTAGLYRALIGLRAADRLLLEVGFFSADDFDTLFDVAKNIPWETFVPARMGLKVTKVRTNRSTLRAETSIQSMVHKAAAIRLCESCGLVRLPETGNEAEVRVYIEKNNVSLLLDLSGEPLFKRGYRIEGGAAPLRETTAAAMLLLSGWKRKYPLYDPFCGSGTILAEAQMYAWDMAPGLGRSFALSRLLIADSTIEEAVRDEFRRKVNFERLIRIAGSDGDESSAALALSNLQRVKDLAEGRKPLFRNGSKQPNVSQTVLPQINALPLQSARPPARPPFSAGDTPDGKDEPSGFIITNPPYGKRLGSREASEQIYSEMGALARNFPGWKLVVITDHPGFESFFGKKAASCREISNGPIPSYIYQYEKL